MLHGLSRRKATKSSTTWCSQSWDAGDVPFNVRTQNKRGHTTLLGKNGQGGKDRTSEIEFAAEIVPEPNRSGLNTRRRHLTSKSGGGATGRVGPPKIQMWKPNLRCGGIGRWAFGRGLGVRSIAPPATQGHAVCPKPGVSYFSRKPGAF